MPELRGWTELPWGYALPAADAARQPTGRWRGGRRPSVELERCIDCLLCWLYCPDAAVVLEELAMRGFDYDVCKGCELCVQVCPPHAIAMVDEEPELPSVQSSEVRS